MRALPKPGGGGKGHYASQILAILFLLRLFVHFIRSVFHLHIYQRHVASVTRVEIHACLLLPFFILWQSEQ